VPAVLDGGIVNSVGVPAGSVIPGGVVYSVGVPASSVGSIRYAIPVSPSGELVDSFGVPLHVPSTFSGSCGDKAQPFSNTTCLLIVQQKLL